MAHTIPHFTAIEDLPPEELLSLFHRTDALIADPQSVHSHRSRIAALLFYEPSTRTRLSFASACCRLDIKTIGFESPEAASVTKGESLIDTIRVVERYSDVIVMRHPCDGAARLASTVASVPIINGGDGAHEHPTQTLYDLYTIWQRFGGLEGKTIGLMGDLRYGRTAHSLAIALSPFNVKLVCVAPDSLQMPESILQRIERPSTFQLESDIESVIADLDVLYLTRLQKERLPEDEREQVIRGYPFTSEHLSFASPDLMIMHPLPRDGEVHYEVDDDPRAWYFEQAANGVPVRMALLDLVLEQCPESRLGAGEAAASIETAPWRPLPGHDADLICSNPKCITRHESGICSRLEPTGMVGTLKCFYCDGELRE